MREKLPHRRKCITRQLKIGTQPVYFSIGLYPDGRPGELFIDMHKFGTAVRAWCGSTAKLVSLMLQYGIPLSEIVDALVGQCTEMSDKIPVSGHEVITETSGVLDAVMRSMALDFLANEGIEKSKDAEYLAAMLYATEDLGSAEIYELVEEANLDTEFANFLGKFE